jgi:hypothetical protein
MEIDTPQPTKLCFFDLCLELDERAMQEIADKAGVAKRVVDDMSLSIAVPRVNAEKVLTAFSQYMGQSYTLDTVKIALFPTFEEIHKKHNFDLATLAMHSGVPYAIVDMMLVNHPVPEKEARLVLQMASRLSEQIYRLEKVDVKLEGGGSHG